MAILLLALAVAAVAFLTGALASSASSAASASLAAASGASGQPQMSEASSTAWRSRKLRLTADIEEVVGCDGMPVESLRTSFALPLSQIDGEVIEGVCSDAAGESCCASLSLLA